MRDIIQVSGKHFQYCKQDKSLNCGSKVYNDYVGP